MPVTRAKRHEMVQRRQQVADLYLKGWTQAAIGQHLGVGQPTVSNDLTALHRQWRESSLRDFDSLRAAQLQKLDRLEREAWAAYERSIGTKQRKHMSLHSGTKVGRIEQWDEPGDPRFLRVVYECIAKRCDLMELKAPMRVSVAKEPDFESLSDEELEAIVRWGREQKLLAGSPRTAPSNSITLDAASSEVEKPEMHKVHR